MDDTSTVEPQHEDDQADFGDPLLRVLTDSWGSDPGSAVLGGWLSQVGC